MFKPGDTAKVRSDGRTVTVSPGRPEGGKWPVATSGGTFEEDELLQGHPSVLATAEARDASADWMRAEVGKAAQKGDSGLSLEIRDELEAALKKAPIDFNGHWKNGRILRKEFKTLDRMFLHRHSASREDAEDLVRAAKSGEPLGRWVQMELSLSMSGLRTCSFCGEDGFGTETNGVAVRLTGQPCAFPEGLPPTEWEMNVPSGKIVVANDLRRLFPLPEDEDFDINTTRGCSQTALAYAENGLAHAFVGNSCPGVYRCKDGTYKVANEPYEDAKPRQKFEGKRVAGVCTDLWWYSICDHDEFKRRLKHFKGKAADFSVEVVDVAPGVYRFRHDEEARSYEGPKECVYTRFERVRGPDPVRDFLAKYESADVNPNAYVHAQVAKWPTLYGRAVNEQAWRRVADHVFCTIGGGVEWHPKGFPTAKVDPSVPDVEPPSFREQCHWYPFSKPYGGLFEPKKLTPSFAKLAFRVLESVISFGTDVRDGERSREVPYVRERMLLAVQRYRELAKQYPEQADPEYAAWLSQKGRAEAWVERFDLGPVFTEKHKKHAGMQRWVPEDAYAVEFDARKLKDGHFTGGGCWANKKDAKGYAIVEWSDNGQAPEHNCFWSSHAANTSVPLYSVARVAKVGEVSHMGETLVELAFDYGSAWMRNPKKRKAVPEASLKAAIRVLSRDEYEKLLPKAESFLKEGK